MDLGANYEEMERLKANFRSESARVQELKSKLESAVSTVVGGGWQGQAAQGFVEAWNSSFRPSLDKLGEALDAAATEVESRQRAYQEADRR